MPQRKLARLAAPVKNFMMDVGSWRPTPLQFKEFQRKWRVTYTVPETIAIRGRDWYCVTAYDVNETAMGRFLLPLKYYPLWRRLVYGALFQERMFEAWIQRTNRLSGRKLKAVEEEMMNLRNMAGVRLIQYLLYRRLVLDELMKLRFENDDPVIHSLIEFGIRESRDWLFETFEDAKRQGAMYLRLDPTEPKNDKEFEKGYHKGLEIVFPPQDDKWWDGNFTHFDFDSVFEEIARSAPKTMADKSFKGTKWVIDSTDQNEPDDWNESGTTFYSEFFTNFLQEGEDPRDVPETYLRWYCNQMDILDVRDGIYQELITVLGDRYDQQRVETLIQQLEQSSDVGEFIKQLMEPWGNEYQGQPTLLPGAQSSHLDLPTDDNSNNNNRLPERAEQILRDFCQQGGLELPQAMEQLVQILGPGSDSVSRKLLTLLGSDPSSDMLDTATAEAIYDLNELKRGNLGDKAPSPLPDTVEDDPTDVVNSINDYRNQSSQLLS